jgi:hypothetical protein
LQKYQQLKNRGLSFTEYKILTSMLLAINTYL